MAALIAACVSLASSVPGQKWASSNDVPLGWLWFGLVLILVALLVGRLAGPGRPPTRSS